VLITNEEVICANIGDSRCVIAEKVGSNGDEETYSHIDMSIDHKPDNPIEKLRIEKAGG
jgi:serine/threonine protein phosphatase PrpC